MDSKLADSSYPLKIGDEEYQASMLTDKDYGSLDNYIKAAYIENAFVVAESLVDENRKDEIKRFAMSQSTNVGWFTHEGINIMATQDGLLHLGFQMLRKQHQTLKFSEFKQQVFKHKDTLHVSLMNITLADKQLNYIKTEEGESRGTPTENDKSV